MDGLPVMDILSSKIIELGNLNHGKSMVHVMAMRGQIHSQQLVGQARVTLPPCVELWQSTRIGSEGISLTSIVIFVLSISFFGRGNAAITHEIHWFI